MSVLFIDNNAPDDLYQLGYNEAIRPSNEEVHKEDFSFDYFIHQRLEKIFHRQRFEVIVLRYSLSSEIYTTYTGLDVALHIRLTPEWNHTHIPILFIGAESVSDVLKLSANGNLLGTPGIFTTQKRNSDDIKKQIEWIQTNNPHIDAEVYGRFLERINIKPPAFYDNRHSIANEWALLLLDAATGHKVLQKKKELRGIKSSLYVKHLLAKLGVEKPDFQPKNNFTIPEARGKKILLIDDEWAKGWLELYGAIFAGAELEHVDLRKGMTEQEVIDCAKKKIKQDEWDLVLLDVRLTDGDHKTDRNYIDYTGFEVLSDVIIDEEEGGDPWSSVIITSASQQYRTYNYGRSLSALGEFIKPGLESRIDEINLDAFKEAALHAFQISTYRKRFSKLLVKNLRTSETFKNLHLLEKSSRSLFDMCITNLKNLPYSKDNKQKGGSLDYAFLNLYGIVENYVKCVTRSKGKTVDIVYHREINIRDVNHWKLTYDKRGFFTRKENLFADNIQFGTLAKFSALLGHVYRKNDKVLKEFGRLNKLRNDTAHGARKKVTKADFDSLLHLVETIDLNRKEQS